MGKLAKLIKESPLSRPEREIVIFDFSRNDLGLNRRVYAVIRYSDPIEFRADVDSLGDKEFRAKFAEECVVKLYDDLSPENKEKKYGALGSLSLRAICPSLMCVSGIPEFNGSETSVELDSEDLIEVIKHLDGFLFSGIYYESISLSSFIKDTIEKEKNELKPTSTSPTPSIPQDSVMATA